MPRPNACNRAGATTTASWPSAAAPMPKRSAPIWRGTHSIPDRAVVSTAARTRETWALARRGVRQGAAGELRGAPLRRVAAGHPRGDQGDRPGGRHAAGDRPQPRPAGTGGDADRHRATSKRASVWARNSRPRRWRRSASRPRTGAAFMLMAGGSSISSRRNGSRRATRLALRQHAGRNGVGTIAARPVAIEISAELIGEHQEEDADDRRRAPLPSIRRAHAPARPSRTEPRRRPRRPTQ